MREKSESAGGFTAAPLRRGRLLDGALLVALYVLATSLTDAFFMADTADYVDSIAEYEAGRYYNFWEFGHLFWRPLGWALYRAAAPLAALSVGDDARAQMTLILVAVNWAAGLACTLLMYGLARRVAWGGRAVWAAVVAFVFAQAVLNYAQSGSSYVPGLAMLLLGLYLLAGGGRGEGPTRRAARLAGLALACAVCLWFPYLWALPGALLSPLLWPGRRDGEPRRGLRAVFEATLACALLGASAYGAVLWHLRIDSAEELRAWVTAAAHGTDLGGVRRMVFGFARSFINMGNDGMLFKRFLVGDPLNPVSAAELFRGSLWKLGLFYLYVLALVAVLLRSREGRRRVLLLWAAGSVPVLVFAAMFDGGAVERYLPLYPFMFAALAYALDDARAPAPLKLVALVFVVAATATNFAAMSKASLGREQESVAGRVGDLPARLAPGSKVFTVNWQDELVNFNRSFPFHPLNRRGRGLLVNSLVTVGTTQVERWRQDFAAQSAAVWGAGGDVWVSRRVLHERPRPDWNWVEGDDRRVFWREFPAFFGRLERGEEVGGEDGFFRLPPTAANRETLGHVPRGE